MNVHQAPTASLTQPRLRVAGSRSRISGQRCQSRPRFNESAALACHQALTRAFRRRPSVATNSRPWRGDGHNASLHNRGFTLVPAVRCAITCRHTLSRRALLRNARWLSMSIANTAQNARSCGQLSGRDRGQTPCCGRHRGPSMSHQRHEPPQGERGAGKPPAGMPDRKWPRPVTCSADHRALV
jgi:hypothetical protein